jgi:hypothetical protein
VDERNSRNGLTALRCCQEAELATLLLDAGAAVEARANDGETPLFVSNSRGKVVDNTPAAGHRRFG